MAMVSVGPLASMASAQPQFLTRTTAGNDPAKWVMPKDLPTNPTSIATSPVGYTVAVGKNGRVTRCTVTSSSSAPDVDAAVCKALTKRARFKPATDLRGRRLDDVYSNRVRIDPSFWLNRMP